MRARFLPVREESYNYGNGEAWMNPTVWNWSQMHPYELTVLKTCTDRDRDNTEMYIEKEVHTEEERGIALARRIERERGVYTCPYLCPCSVH